MLARKAKAWAYPLAHHWHLIFRIGQVYWAHNVLEFQLGFFKIHSFPTEGEVCQKKHYKGFWIRKTFSLPDVGFSYNFPMQFPKFDPNKRYFVGVDTGMEGGDKTVTVIGSQDKKTGEITIESIDTV